MNPWTELPEKPPFVLEQDRKYIEVFNKNESDELRKINTNYVPEARLGPKDAPVLILQLNPSYDKNFPKGTNNKSEVKEAIKIIKDEQALHEGGQKNTVWWGRRLRELRDDVGGETLSKNLMTVDFFPYRSVNFSQNYLRIPSQSYSFELVRNSIEKNAVIIVGRGWKYWCAALPELCERLNETVFVIQNPRCSYFSRNNLGDLCYDNIIKKIK